MKTIRTTEGKRLRSNLERAIELAVDHKEVRPELNEALMKFKSSAPGIMKKAALAVLEKYGGYVCVCVCIFFFLFSFFRSGFQSIVCEYSLALHKNKTPYSPLHFLLCVYIFIFFV
jgi:hypothetical protein